MNKYILHQADKISKADQTIIGGKAWGLHTLSSLGVEVPRWAVLTSHFFSDLQATDAKLISILKKTSGTFEERATLLRERIANFEFAPKHQELLETLWEEISRGDAVAVRSSASDEDNALLSFAGQMDTALNIHTLASFKQAVCDCWASLYGERAVMYRLENNIYPFTAKMGVVVQCMVNAEAAGVVFTQDPVTGAKDRIVISSVWGLGEGLVSGALDADTFILGRDGTLIKSELASKEQEIVYDENGGTVFRNLPDDRKEAPTLSDEMLQRIKKAALIIEDASKMPMDIEFATLDDSLYILQARPITTNKSQGELNIWDNSNIAESYCGVTTPLTFSFIRRAYYAVYCQFAQVIGVSKKRIRANEKMYKNMLGLIRGRVYYNLLNWYRLVAMMPGFEYNKNFMEQMMGLQVSPEVNLTQQSESRLKKLFVHLPRLVRVGLKMVFAHLTLPLRIKSFHKNFNKIYNKYAETDFNSLSPRECVDIYRELEDKVLWRWRAPIINDFEAMIFYGLLKQKMRSWEIDPESSLQNDLLCGEGNITSTEVITELYGVASIINEYPEIARELAQLEPKTALKKLQTDEKLREANRAFEEYLKQYGVRSVEEMKLESVPMKDNPSFAIAMIQNYLRAQKPISEPDTKREAKIRKAAERKALKRLGFWPSILLIPKRWIFKWILKNTRASVKNRENQRFARTQAYSLVRSLFRSIGQTWAGEGLLGDSEDIFYLELQEIFELVDNPGCAIQPKILVKERRAEFGEYENTPAPPDHIEAHVEIEHIDFSQFQDNEECSEDLKGLGCCQGIVDATVKVVEKPNAQLRLDGEIMVAKQTDPGWTVLFPSISGLIVEKGSMLSHSAIVAREMGIPCIVGVKNATQILKDDDRVKMNGDTGTILVLAEEDEV